MKKPAARKQRRKKSPQAARASVAAAKRKLEQLSRANADLRKKLRLLERALAASERDRKLVAYEIHDTILQDVLGAVMLLEAAVARDRLPNDVARRLDEARAMLRKSIDGTRRMISGLGPRALDEGLAGAVEQLARGFGDRGLEIRFSHALPAARLSAELESAAYRIVQEALTNVARHSQSARAEVKLKIRAGKLYLSIRDFGVGLDPAAESPGHVGLEGLKARARLAGGRATIKSIPGQGTAISAVLPIGKSSRS